MTGWEVALTIVGGPFEECLEFAWELRPPEGRPLPGRPPPLSGSLIELVIDRSEGDEKSSEPPKDAMVKRVPAGKDMTASLQNMPEGRWFFAAVVCTLAGGSKMRSDWMRARTLSPKTRDRHLSNLDPMAKPRLNCQNCPCPGYVPMKWDQFLAVDKVKCRRCGCPCERHVVVDVPEILRERADKACKRLLRSAVVPLPEEAVRWDDRECDLWFLSEGEVHPRRTVGAFRPPPRDSVSNGGPGGADGVDGRRGRVSVVTPTTESRQRFHESLWKCFEAQQWPDKELVVIETYTDFPSELFERMAKQDSRLTYLKYKRPAGSDWSIGLKRNIAANVATGEFIANFDDDDLYAPSYLKTMVGELEAWRVWDSVCQFMWARHLNVNVNCATETRGADSNEMLYW